MTIAENRKRALALAAGCPLPDAWNHPVPPVLYKYLAADRLDVLRSCRIRFTQRAHFKDDHEFQPDYDKYGTFEEIKWFKEILLHESISDSAARAIADSPGNQQLALEAALTNIKSFDNLGILCLTATGHSERMWSEYADEGRGFVLAFDTTHASFEKLVWPLGVGKVSYDSNGYSTFLGMLKRFPFGPLYGKRPGFSYEEEWRAFHL